MRYLGIDYGTKKVGLALSDEAGMMGFPHTTLPVTSELVAAIAALIIKERVGGVVIGESRNYQGTENPVAALARSFASELTEVTGTPVFFEPEMLTTQEARRFPDGVRMKGSPDVDAAAAALILTSFLEHHVPRPPSEPNIDI